MRLPAPALLMSDGQREVLERLAKSSAVPHREVTRAKALLLAADGMASTAIAARLGVSPSRASRVSVKKKFRAARSVRAPRR